MTKPESIIDQACMIAEKRWHRRDPITRFIFPENLYIHRLHRLIGRLPEATFAASFVYIISFPTETSLSQGVLASTIMATSAATWGIKDCWQRHRSILDRLVP